jgi:hypothetical protein
VLVDLCNAAADRFPAIDLACVLLSYSAPGGQPLTIGISNVISPRRHGYNEPAEK